jgi:hypothetical protein
MGSFVHSRWFLVYPLMGYDWILGKDFMEEVPQEIELSTNVLHLPNSVLRGVDCCDRDRLGPPWRDQSLEELHSVWCQYSSPTFSTEPAFTRVHLKDPHNTLGHPDMPYYPD